MAGYKVKIDQDCVDSYHSGEQYGEWREAYRNNLEYVSKGGEYPDVVSVLDIAPGEVCFVVWIEYSSGDSFGHSERGGVEAVGIFKDKAAADELKNAIMSHNPDRNTSDWKNKYNLQVVTCDGQHFDLYTGSWHDYFGGLDEVNVDVTLMG